MKNIKYIIYAVVFLFLNIFYVNASCTDMEINTLKELASDIKISYKHLGMVETDDLVDYNSFEVKVKNIPDDLYISLFNGTTVLTPVDGEIVEIFNNGTWNFEIYSSKCEKKITEIDVFIPRFNIYSFDPLCEGIDGEDFPLCGKYYEYDVSYESFRERVNYYRATHKIDDVDNNDTEKNTFELILDNLLDYIVKYRLYIVITLVVILIALNLIILIKRKKKRGVLE